MKVILNVENLFFSYGEKKILENVDFELFDKSICAIYGSSGSGKTTFLSILSLLFREENNYKISGKVLLEDKDILKIKKDYWRLRRKIIYISQKPNPLHTTIYRNLTFPLKISGIRINKQSNMLIESVLRKVNLWNEVKDRLNKSALELSGGQQQKLCISRALILSPKILLLDEPTSSLDTKNKILVENLIVGLKKELSVLFVSHEPEQIKRISDYQYKCVDKKIIKTDSIDVESG